MQRITRAIEQESGPRGSTDHPRSLNTSAPGGGGFRGALGALAVAWQPSWEDQLAHNTRGPRKRRRIERKAEAARQEAKAAGEVVPGAPDPADVAAHRDALDQVAPLPLARPGTDLARALSGPELGFLQAVGGEELLRAILGMLDLASLARMSRVSPWFRGLLKTVTPLLRLAYGVQTVFRSPRARLQTHAPSTTAERIASLATLTGIARSLRGNQAAPASLGGHDAPMREVVNTDWPRSQGLEAGYLAESQLDTSRGLGAFALVLLGQWVDLLGLPRQRTSLFELLSILTRLTTRLQAEADALTYIRLRLEKRESQGLPGSAQELERFDAALARLTRLFPQYADTRSFRGGNLLLLLAPLANTLFPPNRPGLSGSDLIRRLKYDSMRCSLLPEWKRPALATQVAPAGPIARAHETFQLTRLSFNNMPLLMASGLAKELQAAKVSLPNATVIALRNLPALDALPYKQLLAMPNLIGLEVVRCPILLSHSLDKQNSLHRHWIRRLNWALHPKQAEKIEADEQARLALLRHDDQTKQQRAAQRVLDKLNKPRRGHRSLTKAQQAELDRKKKEAQRAVAAARDAAQRALSELEGHETELKALPKGYTTVFEGQLPSDLRLGRHDLLPRELATAQDFKQLLSKLELLTWHVDPRLETEDSPDWADWLVGEGHDVKLGPKLRVVSFSGGVNENRDGGWLLHPHAQVRFPVLETLVLALYGTQEHWAIPRFPRLRKLIVQHGLGITHEKIARFDHLQLLWQPSIPEWVHLTTRSTNRQFVEGVSSRAEVPPTLLDTKSHQLPHHPPRSLRLVVKTGSHGMFPRRPLLWKYQALPLIDGHTALALIDLLPEWRQLPASASQERQLEFLISRLGARLQSARSHLTMDFLTNEVPRPLSERQAGSQGGPSHRSFLLAAASGLLPPLAILDDLIPDHLTIPSDLDVHTLRELAKPTDSSRLEVHTAIQDLPSSATVDRQARRDLGTVDTSGAGPYVVQPKPKHQYHASAEADLHHGHHHHHHHGATDSRGKSLGGQWSAASGKSAGLPVGLKTTTSAGVGEDGHRLAPHLDLCLAPGTPEADIIRQWDQLVDQVKQRPASRGGGKGHLVRLRLGQEAVQVIGRHTTRTDHTVLEGVQGLLLHLQMPGHHGQGELPVWTWRLCPNVEQVRVVQAPGTRGGVFIPGQVVKDQGWSRLTHLALEGGTSTVARELLTSLPKLRSVRLRGPRVLVGSTTVPRPGHRGKGDELRANTLTPSLRYLESTSRESGPELELLLATAKAAQHPCHCLTGFEAMVLCAGLADSPEEAGFAGPVLGGHWTLGTAKVFGLAGLTPDEVWDWSADAWKLDSVLQMRQQARELQRAQHSLPWWSWQSKVWPATGDSPAMHGLAKAFAAGVDRSNRPLKRQRRTLEQEGDTPATAAESDQATEEDADGDAVMTAAPETKQARPGIPYGSSSSSSRALARQFHWTPQNRAPSLYQRILDTGAGRGAQVRPSGSAPAQSTLVEAILNRLDEKSRGPTRAGGAAVSSFWLRMDRDTLVQCAEFLDHQTLRALQATSTQLLQALEPVLRVMRGSFMMSEWRRIPRYQGLLPSFPSPLIGVNWMLGLRYLATPDLDVKTRPPTDLVRRQVLALLRMLTGWAQTQKELDWNVRLSVVFDDGMNMIANQIYTGDEGEPARSALYQRGDVIFANAVQVWRHLTDAKIDLQTGRTMSRPTGINTDNPKVWEAALYTPLLTEEDRVVREFRLVDQPGQVRGGRTEQSGTEQREIMDREARRLGGGPQLLLNIRSAWNISVVYEDKVAPNAIGLRLLSTALNLPELRKLSLTECVFMHDMYWDLLGFLPKLDTLSVVDCDGLVLGLTTAAQQYERHGSSGEGKRGKFRAVADTQARLEALLGPTADRMLAKHREKKLVSRDSAVLREQEAAKGQAGRPQRPPPGAPGGQFQEYTFQRALWYLTELSLLLGTHTHRPETTTPLTNNWNMPWLDPSLVLAPRLTTLYLHDDAQTLPNWLTHPNLGGQFPALRMLSFTTSWQSPPLKLNALSSLPKLFTLELVRTSLHNEQDDGEVNAEEYALHKFRELRFLHCARVPVPTLDTIEGGPPHLRLVAIHNRTPPTSNIRRIAARWPVVRTSIWKLLVHSFWYYRAWKDQPTTTDEEKRSATAAYAELREMVEEYPDTVPVWIGSVVPQSLRLPTYIQSWADRFMFLLDHIFHDLTEMPWTQLGRPALESWGVKNLSNHNHIDQDFLYGNDEEEDDREPEGGQAAGPGAQDGDHNPDDSDDNHNTGDGPPSDADEAAE